MTYPVKKESDRGIFTAVMDLDNTLAEDTWPDNTIGDIIDRGLEILLHLREQGNEIVIYTARPESHKPAIWAWLAAHGLGKVVYDVVCGKPRGWVLVDDRAWNPNGQEAPDEWLTKAELLPDETLEQRAERLGYPADTMKREPAPRAAEASHAERRISTGKAQPAPGKKQAGYDDDQWTVVG